MASIVNHQDNCKSFLSCLTGQQCNENNPSNSFHQQNPHHHDNSNEMRHTQMLLASEMNKLSVQERSTVLDDVHCVGEALVETPEMVQQSLDSFGAAIQHHQRKNTNFVYELALQQNRSYIEDPSFRLPFLRADMHNVNRAVRRMMNFLQYKAQYFGTERLTRDITLDDLSEEEQELILAGTYHIQDGRDRNGRAIVYLFNHMLGRIRAETLIRVAYYFWVHVVLPIPEIQIKGANTIYYDVAIPGKDPSPSLNFSMTVMKFAAVLPIRHSSMHMCVKNGMTGNLEVHDTIIGFALKKFSPHDIVRTSLLFGSDLELQYQLRSKGIPVDDSFPVDANGNLRQKDILNKWLYDHINVNERMVMESQLPNDGQQPLLPTAEGTMNFQNDWNLQPFLGIGGGHQHQILGEQPSSVMAVEEDNSAWIQHELLMQQLRQLQQHQNQQQQQQVQPTNRDVLNGKGTRIQNHPGNVHFRAFLAEHSDEYDNAKRKEKPQICTKMATILQSQGIRFFKQQSPEVWIECDLQEASKKVGDFFRTIRKKKK